MQTKAEAEHLMEQQHYGGDYVSPQDAGLADPDEEQADESYWYEHIADLCANCAHMRESHVDYTEDCSEVNCECLHFKEPEMKLKIFKYPLTMDGDTTLELPRNAQILSVGTQNSQLYLWALIDTEIGVIESRYFRSLGTGWLITKPGKFIGTALFFEGNLVLHVFEVNL